MKKWFASIVVALLLSAAPVQAQQNDATTSGNLTAPAQAVMLDLNAFGTTAVQVTGTWTGTLQFEATVDGTTYFSVQALQMSTQTPVTSTTSNDSFLIATAGFSRVRVRASSLASGTAVVNMQASPPTSYPAAVAGGAASNVTVVNAAPIDVNCASGCSSSGFLDNATFTVGAEALTNIGGVRLDAPADVVNGDAAVVRITPKRGLHVNIRDNSGAELFTAAAALADATANPTLTKIQTFQMAWNIDASNWNRQVQYADGDSSITKVGALLMGENGGGVIRTARVHDDGGLVVNQGAATGIPWGVFIASPDGVNAADVVAGQGLQVFSTDFDIRNLVFATDKVDVSGSSVSVSASALPAGAATAALQTQPGVDIGDVTVNNAAGAGAVNIQDGGNSITVDATTLPLPTGASTSSLQTTGNTSLSSIDGKFPTTSALSDGLSNPTLTKIQTFGMVWNSAANQWDRMHGSGLIGDGIAATGTGNVSVRGFNLGWNGTSWDRVVTGAVTADGVTPSTIGNLQTRTFMQSYNGSTWDMVRSGATNADNIATATVGALNSRGFNFVWDGVTWDRLPGNSTDGASVKVTSSALPTGAATAANQTNGTQQTQLVDAGGASVNVTGTSLDINCTAGCTTGAPFEDNDAFTVNTTTVTNMGALVDETSTSNVTEDSAGAPRMSPNRNLYIQIRDINSERSAGVTSTNALQVDTELLLSTPSDSFSNPAATAAQAMGFTMVWDSLNSNWQRLRNVQGGGASGASQDGEINPRLSSFGSFNYAYNGSTWDRLRGNTSGLFTQGAGASGAAKAGNPVQQGGVFNTTQPTVTTGQTVEAQMTARGAQIIAAGVEGLTVTANAGTNLNTSALLLDATLTNRFPAGANPADNESNTSSQSRIGAYSFIFDGAAWDRWTGAVTQGGTWNIGTVTTVTAVTAISNALPAGNNNIGDVDVVTLPAIPTGSNIIGRVGIDQTTPGTTNKVSVGNDVVTTKEQRATTPAVTSVAGSASNVTCLASNANRLGAVVYNDSTADLYVKLGATASTTSFTVKLFSDGAFTVPFGYTGIIDCIWSSAAGSARVTEVTQ